MHAYNLRTNTLRIQTLQRACVVSCQPRFTCSHHSWGTALSPVVAGSVRSGMPHTAPRPGWLLLFTEQEEIRLDHCLTTGQSFRWFQDDPSVLQFTGVIGQRLVRMHQNLTGGVGDGAVWYQVIGRVPEARPDQDDEVIRDYFNLPSASDADDSEPTSAAAVRLSQLSQQWAAACTRYAKVRQHIPGARMLRQDPVECLFQFICSSNNHISRIHGMVSSLCRMYGTPITPIVDLDEPSYLACSAQHALQQQQKCSQHQSHQPIKQEASATKHESSGTIHVVATATAVHAVSQASASSPTTSSDNGAHAVHALDHAMLDVSAASSPVAVKQEILHDPVLPMSNTHMSAAQDSPANQDRAAKPEPVLAAAQESPQELLPPKKRRAKRVKQEPEVVLDSRSNKLQEEDLLGAAVKSKSGRGAKRGRNTNTPAPAEEQGVRHVGGGGGGGARTKASPSKAAVLPSQRQYYAFPTLEQLSKATEDELRQAGFGYRAKFIVGSVEMLLSKPGGGRDWLLQLRQSSFQEAVEALEELPGVGPKVAACVALFSLDKHDAIPVDTHVWKIAVQHYLPSLKGKALTKKVHGDVQAAFVQRFGPYAGWAHNAMFIAELAGHKHKVA